MKNSLSKISIYLLLFVFITSCSVNSLEDEGLMNEASNIALTNNSQKNATSTLYISWEEGVTETDKFNLRENLMFSQTIIQLYSFQIDASNENREEWQITYESQDVTKPIIFVKEETVVENASFEPF
ncbi:MAG: hypothetical protein ACSHWW_05170 [Nonlabens sp.]|uniref:hypothetical protein n=1 Tax=Nonlabens sp. TaxID=1888209 RepID=UPI003EF874E8